MGNNAFKRQYSNAFKIKYYNFFYQNGITGNYLGFWEHYMAYIYVFIYKTFYLLLLLIFFSFQIKTSGFHLKRRREGVVGDANDSISK